MAPEPWTDPYAVLDAGEGVDRRTGEVRPGPHDPGAPADGDVSADPVADGPVEHDRTAGAVVDATAHGQGDGDGDGDGRAHGDGDSDADGVAESAGAPVPGFGQEDVLNPAQQDVVALLGAKPSERPQFDAELRHHLRAELEAGLAPILDQLPDETQLFVSKYPLSQIHGCEDKFLAERAEPFTWTPATARGSVSHKAVELSLHWDRDPVPLELVDEAIARLSFGSGSLADWLQTATTVDRAEVRAQANERVSKFLECFPPLKPAWRPVTESAAKVELFSNRIVLQGRVDLTLGHTRGTTANKVLIDFKSGGFSPSHVDDLRFYALLETIRMGTPPRLVATYYLDSGRPFPEAIHEGVLDAALHRTIDGARRMADLLHGQAAPVRRAGPSCRWCPMLDRCEDGQTWLRRTDDDLDQLDVDEDA